MLKIFLKKKDGFDYLNAGSEKIVYQHGDYVAALIPKKIILQENEIPLIKKMRLSREWYQETFGNEFLNQEKLIEKNNVIIWMQKYQEFQDKELFYDIVKNKEKIISYFQEKTETREKLLFLFRKILEVYEKEGLIPDLFNAISLKENNPANLYLTKENRLLFIDSHTINFDKRKTDGKKYPFARYVTGKIQDYLDNLIQSMEEIIESLSK